MENEYAFQLSCKNGHFEVAKWLWSLEGFNLSMINNNEVKSKMIKWLWKKAMRKAHIVRTLINPLNYDLGKPDSCSFYYDMGLGLGNVDYEMVLLNEHQRKYLRMGIEDSKKIDV